MELEVTEGDLLDAEVDAIVNAWNRNIVPWWLLLPRGVSGAIKKRAGYGPFRELAKHGRMSLGTAVRTSAGKLPHKAIIHVAGIKLPWGASEQSIRDSVGNALRIASENGLRSVAFPVIGAGCGGFDEDVALEIMLGALDGVNFGGKVVIVRFERKKR